MSTGFRRVQYNTRERALSSDNNTLQTYQEQDFAEWMRAFVDSTWTRSSLNVTEAEHSILATPVVAAIFQGLLVQPQAASNDILVRGGVACFINPDAAPNESNYKFIRDVGVLAPGTLAIPPNGGLSAVVHVIECRVHPTPLSVIQNRDVFDPTTGLFTPTPVTKETQGRLEYRVRSGGVGGGYPGNAAGWLPLCVVVAPASSTDNDDCEFWDVRPMLQDRLYGPMNIQNDEARVILDGSFADNQTSGTPSGNPELTGVVEANYAGWVAGGTFKTTVGLVDANYMHTGAAGPNADPLNPPALFAVMLSVFAVFPFGLPRWCRYNRTPVARLPGPFNGIPVISSRAAGPAGEIQAGLPVRLPTSLGFGAAVDVTTGVALITAPNSSTTANMTGCSLRQRKVIWGDLNAWQVAPTAFTATSHTYTLTENANFPRNIMKFAHWDAAYFTAIPGFNTLVGVSPAGTIVGPLNSATLPEYAGQSVLLARSAIFTPSGYNIEESMALREWVPPMQNGQPAPQSNQRLYWQSIPVVHPDTGAVVHTYARSFGSMSPTGFTLVPASNLFILGWEMR